MGPSPSIAALDEIVFVGHSLGAMLVLDVVVRAFARDADFGKRGAITIGATIPKFALHPRAHVIRRKIADVAIDRLDGISVARRYSRRLA
jgi:hypothetical protein